jgi:hypothetical protein
MENSSSSVAIIHVRMTLDGDLWNLPAALLELIRMTGEVEISSEEKPSRRSALKHMATKMSQFV